MRDEGHLLNIACYATLLAVTLPVLQILRQSSPFASIALAVFVIVVSLFAYSIVRLRWQLPEWFDNTFDYLAPLVFLLSIVIVICTIAFRQM